MSCLRSGDLSSKDFLQLIETYEWPEPPLLMAFSAAEARFGRYAFDNAFLSQTEQGRIFSAGGEIKWRQVEGLVRVVYLGKGPGPGHLTDYSQELAGLSPLSRQFLLWGVRTDTQSEWIEQHVPHRFSYPIDTARSPRGRVALIVEDWADRSGVPQFSRYQGIIEVEGGQ